MQPREPGTPPLGQLLVDRGVLTSTQLYQISLEERVTGKALGDIILERGLASPEVLENASADIADVTPTKQSVEGKASSPSGAVIDSGASPNALQRPEDDAEWRQRLFRRADGEDQGRDVQAEIPEQPPRGLRARAARRLDDYLATTASELDERWETLRGRSLAFEQEAERLAATESALSERARRLHEIGIPDEGVSRQIDSLIEVVAERDRQIDLVGSDLARAQEKLALLTTEAATRDRLLAEKEEQAVALSASIDGMRTELRAAAADIARRDEIVARLEQEGATHARELANTREQLEERTGRVSDLERYVKEKEAALSAREQQLRELRAENTTLNASRERAAALLAERGRFVRDLAARLEDELSRLAGEEAAGAAGRAYLQADQ